MIARGVSRHDGLDSEGPCDEHRLAALLDDTLGRDESDRLTRHLDTCPDCRRRLESLAGGQDDWTTVRDSLRIENRDTPPHEQPYQTSEIAVSCEVPWVRSLLKPSAASDLGTLGPYVIRSVIGQGGMGVVLQAWDDELNRPLALKLLAPHLASSGPARQRFLREARAAAAIVHPNVIPIYSVTADSAVPYLVMPLIGGGNLQQRIDRDGPLDLEDCLRVGLQIAEGLSAAHRQGLIHRDIKPANILLEEGGHRVLISDFGLARALDDVSMTLSGLIAGTPPYMSPEQARGESIQCASDLFSLGSVMYAMSTGRSPYRGESPLAVLRQIGECKPTPVCEINERMPAWFGRLIELLMRNDAVDRPVSADAVADLIRGCLSHVRDGRSDSLPKTLIPKSNFTSLRLAGGVLAITAVSFGLSMIFLMPQQQRLSQSPPVPLSADSKAGQSMSIQPESKVDSQLGPILSIEIEIERTGKAIEKLYRDVFTELETIRQEEGVFNE
jgi:serine/threonine-protein kinase